MFRRKHWQISNVYNSNKKVVVRTDKKGEEVAKNISYDYNLLIAQDLWEAHY